MRKQYYTTFEFNDIDRCIHFYAKNSEMMDYDDMNNLRAELKYYDEDFIVNSLHYYKDALIVYITEILNDDYDHKNIKKMIYKNGKIVEIDYLEELFIKAKTQSDYLELIGSNAKYYEFTPDKYKNNPNFMLKAFEDVDTYKFNPLDAFNTNDLMCNKDFLLKVVKRYNKEVFNDNSLDDDEKIIVTFQYHSLPDKLFLNKDFLEKALKINYNKYFKYLDIGQQKEKIKENIKLLEYANKMLFEDIDFMNSILFNDYIINNIKEGNVIEIFKYLSNSSILEFLKYQFFNNYYEKNILNYFDYKNKQSLLNSQFYQLDNDDQFFKDFVSYNSSECLILPDIMKLHNEDNNKIEFLKWYEYNSFIVCLKYLNKKDIEDILNSYKQFILEYFNLNTVDSVAKLKKDILNYYDNFVETKEKKYKALFFYNCYSKSCFIFQIINLICLNNDKDFVYELLIRYYDYCIKNNVNEIGLLLYSQQNIDLISELSSSYFEIDRYKVLSNYKDSELLFKIVNEDKNDNRFENKLIYINPIVTFIGNNLINNKNEMEEIIEKYSEYILPF